MIIKHTQNSNPEEESTEDSKHAEDSVVYQNVKIKVHLPRLKLMTHLADTLKGNLEQRVFSHNICDAEGNRL